MNKCLIKRKSGISTSLSFIALAIIILVIGSIVAYFYIYHLKLTTQVETSELARQETRLLEKLSLILWYKSGNKGIAIISNDGEIPVYIKKIYADGQIKDISSNPIIINPQEKIEAETPYDNGQSLMVETSSGNLIKFVEGGFTITGTTWVGSLPTEITTTSYVSTTITTTQTSISPTTITTTYLTTQTLTSYIPTTYTTTFTTTTPTTITTTTPITYTTTIPTTITQTLTTTTPTTITQTLSTTQTLTSYIPTTYTTTYATTGTTTITTTIPTTITTTKSTTQTITSYVPTTYTSIITTTTVTQTLTQTTTRTVVPTTYTSYASTTITLTPLNTLYFRGDQWTINELTAYQLSNTQSSIEKYASLRQSMGSGTSFYGYFGVRVWKRYQTNGLFGIWYDTYTLSGNIIARLLHPIIDFTDINPAGKTDYYSGIITGYIYAPYSETYTFYITSDDGVRLYVNNQKIIDAWTTGSKTVSGNITLNGGQWYPIRIEHYEYTGSERLLLEWSSPSIPRQKVPYDKLKCFAEDEITSGSPVAVASQKWVTDNPTFYTISATWNRPDVYLYSSDSSIVVRVYGRITGNGDTGWIQLAEFTTSQIGLEKLPASTWIVYYTVYVWIEGSYYYIHFDFYWGTTTRNSRIVNFVPSTTITTSVPATTITTITDYLGSIFIGENSPAFLITLCIIAVSITIEIKERIKNEKQRIKE
jgi:hypothetical protein